MRAKVIFTDGFFTSPCVETTNENLGSRIQSACTRRAKEGPSTVATEFLVESAAGGYPACCLNVPEGMSMGVTMARISNPSYWPGDGSQAGVFLVHTIPGSEFIRVQVWGGKGFSGMPEFTPTIPQEVEIPLGKGEAEG